MKKYFLISILIFAGLYQQLSAQNEIDALRYSQVFYGGTARSVAMGGAFGALGGDFASLSINPAGIGIYKNTEITLTPSNYYVIMKSNYNNNASDDRKYNFNLNNLGVVFVIKPKKEASACKGIQMGIGFNRLNDYNYNAYMEGGNSHNSIINDYVNQAQGSKPEDLQQFSTQLAFNTYLIDTLGSLTNYIGAIPNGGALQSKSLNVTGSNNELVLTLGGNWNDKLYIGGTVGFPYVRYYESSTYKETDKADTIAGFKSMAYNYNLQTRGTGFNFKLGVIYRITDWVRIGAAVHTPTFYSMKDTWSSDMQSEFKDGSKFTSSSPNGSYDYQLTTPFKADGSLAFIIGKYALISGDYEFIDYRNARLKASTYNYTDENRAIDNDLACQSNVRAGVEVKIKNFSIRGGYTFSNSPYATKLKADNRQAFSGGLGVKFDRYFIDLAYSYVMSKQKYYLYPSVPTAVDNTITGHNALLTFGVKFK